MNIMNVNNTTFGVRPGVKWARNSENMEYPVNKILRDKIASVKSELEVEAKRYKANVTLAQKGDSLLVNSGTVTTRVEDTRNKTPETLYKMILDNIDINNLIRNNWLTVNKL